MKLSYHVNLSWLQQMINHLKIPRTLTSRGLQLGVVVLSGLGIGLAVIVATYYVDNVKLLAGLVGGIAFVLLTMRWPELSILFFLALLSGLISLTWLPILHLGPISLNISDMVLFLLLGLLFLRVTTQSGFQFSGSPLILPLVLFIGAFLLSAVNGILFAGVGFNEVLRTVRVLILWIAFLPTLQLIRDESALRRFLLGLLIFTAVLLVGVLFPNKFDPFLYMEVREAGTGAEMYSDFNRVYFAGDMVLYAMIPVTVASLAIIKKGNQLWRLGLLALLLFWAFRTFFRQYWLTLFVICIILLWFLSSQERIRILKRVTPALVIGVLLLCILFTIQPARIERIQYVITDRLGSLLKNPFSREGSLQWRVIESRYAWDQISRHPILGIGLANNYRPPMVNESENIYSGWAANYIENGYLYITVMMGIVGLLPFLALCGFYLFRVFHYQREIQDDSLRAIYLGFGLAFVGMMACNLASPTFVIGTRLIFFPVSMAICEVILRLEQEKRSLRQDFQHESKPNPIQLPS